MEKNFNNGSNDPWELEKNDSAETPLVDNSQPTSTELVVFSLDTPIPENSGALPELISFIQLTQAILQNAAGHDAYQARKIAYYIFATWHIAKFEQFPGLVFYGPPSSGKTSSLNVVKALAFHVSPITADGITEAALRKTMADANNGTLIIEEADKLTARDLESFVIARYSKSSAQVSKMESAGKNWDVAPKATFGATVLHRRNLFRDPATLRRMIKVKTKRQHKKFISLSSATLKLILNRIRTISDLPIVENVWDIEPGVFDCFAPVVRIAKYFSDEAFINRLVEEMKQESVQLKEEETYLEGPTILKTLVRLAVDHVKENPKADRFGIHVKEINPAIKDEFGSDCQTLLLSANQRNRILREDFKFQIKSSNGKNWVYLTLPMLMSVCADNNITDDVFAVWKEKLNLK